MLDAATVLLREYYRATGWNEQRSYSNLTTASDVLLDFPVPDGVLFSFASARTPTLYSGARLLALPLSMSLGFTYVETRAAMDPLCVRAATHRMVRAADFLEPDRLGGADAGRARDRSDSPSESARRPTPRDTLLYGSFHVPTSCVDAVAVSRLGASWQVLGTALSRAPTFPLVPLRRWFGLAAPGAAAESAAAAGVGPPGTTNLHLALQRLGAHTLTEYSYSVDDALWGFRFLRTFPSFRPHAVCGTLSAGAELFVSVAEKSAGLSMGLRYAMPSGFVGGAAQAPVLPSVATLTLNPMMGYARAAYIARIADDLVVGTRYDFNVYSYLSDLSIGAEYSLCAAADDVAWERGCAERRAPLPQETAAVSVSRHAPLQLETPGVSLSRQADGMSLREDPQVAVAVEAPVSSPSGRLGSMADASGAVLESGTGPGADVRDGAVDGACAETQQGPPAEHVRRSGALPNLLGVIKARVSASGMLSVLWEGRWSRNLVSVGLQSNLHVPELAAASALGVEIVYVGDDM
ncbi:Mitochondrial distribution and morphology protein 10 [Malassezia sp. CBS 17886]|nr:Mitochondrial distribution and morphology protein 10 [Malassezia sp. CBS 17886]